MSNFETAESDPGRGASPAGETDDRSMTILGHSLAAWRALIGQMMKYGIFGGIGAGTDFLLYTILVAHGDVPALVANVVSILAGITVSFLLNSRLTFRRTDNRLIRASRFLLVGLSGMGLSTAMLAGLTGWAGMNPIWAKVITLPLVALFQFILNKRWTFSAKVG